MKFQHFILTRFNVKMWSKDKHGAEVLTENWQKHRFDLFQNYCLPSIASQINSNFKWIVYFDKNTDKTFLNKITNIQSNYSCFLPVFVQDSSHMFDTYKKDIINLIDSEIDYLITTRLDNDDCLSKNAIQKIQTSFHGAHIGIINLYCGYVYDIDKKILVKRNLSSNPFIYLKEKYLPDEIQTVWSGEHGHLSKQYNLIDICDDNYWLQIVHKRNVINDLYRKGKVYKPIRLRNLQKKFEFKIPLEISTINYLLELFQYYMFKIKKKY